MRDKEIKALVQEVQRLFPARSVLSREEVLSMQEFAKSKGMEVVPLVQTFGHMEVRRTFLLLPVNASFSVRVRRSPRGRRSSVTVRAEASAHVDPERDGDLRGHPEPPPRGRREAGDGDAEAGGGAASGLDCAAHRSRRGAVRFPVGR